MNKIISWVLLSGIVVFSSNLLANDVLEFGNVKSLQGVNTNQPLIATMTMSGGKQHPIKVTLPSHTTPLQLKAGQEVTLGSPHNGKYKIVGVTLLGDSIKVTIEQTSSSGVNREKMGMTKNSYGY